MIKIISKTHFLQLGLHNVSVVASNVLEDSPPAYLLFEVVIGVENWTVTADQVWIKENPGAFNEYYYVRNTGQK